MVRGFGVFLPYVWTLGWLCGRHRGHDGGVPLRDRARDRRHLFAASRWVLAFSAGALYLKLAALLHPSKPLVDALFHAHRLEWVLGGKCSVHAAALQRRRLPVRDRPVSVCRAVGGVDTQPRRAPRRRRRRARSDRGWPPLSDGRAHLWTIVSRVPRPWCSSAGVPIAYDIVGHANLTNAFGQSVGARRDHRDRADDAQRGGACWPSWHRG